MIKGETVLDNGLTEEQTAVLADLDFQPTTTVPEITRDRTAMSPTVLRAIGFVADQELRPKDGSLDLNFPEINAFQSAF